jgi:hypothetical protein
MLPALNPHASAECKVDAVNKQGRTALMAAVERDSAECVQV